MLWILGSSILCRPTDLFNSSSISCRDNFHWGIKNLTSNLKVSKLDIEIKCSRLTILHTKFRHRSHFLQYYLILAKEPSFVWTQFFLKLSNFTTSNLKKKLRTFSWFYRSSPSKFYTTRSRGSRIMIRQTNRDYYFICKDFSIFVLSV